MTTAEQIQEAVNERDDRYFWSEVRYGNTHLEGIGDLVHIDSYGGEGEGETAWVVFQVGDQYFRMDGYYMSYDGFTWDGDLYEVEPFEKTVTDWRTKK